MTGDEYLDIEQYAINYYAIDLHAVDFGELSRLIAINAIDFPNLLSFINSN